MATRCHWKSLVTTTFNLRHLSITGHLLRDLNYFSWIKIYRHYNLNIEIFLSRLKVFELLFKILLSLLKLSFGLVFVIIQ